jgi:hypothetical protein
MKSITTSESERQGVAGEERETCCESKREERGG